MTASDVMILSERLGLHLRKNHFSACREIIDSAETEYLETVLQDERGGREITTIAELKNVPLGTVTLLERKGYMYLENLDGVDLKNLHKSILHLGEKQANGLSIAVEEARKHNELVRKRTELLAEENNVGCPPADTC